MKRKSFPMADGLRASAKWITGAALTFITTVALAQSGWSPIPGNYHTVLNTRSSTLNIWRMAELTDVLVLDFPTLTQQGKTFNRITQLTEQFVEPYKRVLSNEEFSRYLTAIRRNDSNFAFGHDVLVSELALFYNLTDRDKIELTAEESALREFLIEQGLIRSWRGITQALKPDTVLIAIPQTRERGDGEPRITEFARRAILLHELSHGEFYTNPYYTQYCRKFWSEVMTDNQRAAFARFLAKYNYSINQEELLINEMQAYLMFTPDTNSFSAARLGVTDGELASLRAAFRQGKPPTRLPLDN